MTPAEILALTAFVEQLLSQLPTITTEVEAEWNAIKSMITGSTTVVPNTTLDSQMTEIQSRITALQAQVAALKSK